MAFGTACTASRTQFNGVSKLFMIGPSLGRAWCMGWSGLLLRLPVGLIIEHLLFRVLASCHSVLENLKVLFCYMLDAITGRQ